MPGSGVCIVSRGLSLLSPHSKLQMGAVRTPTLHKKRIQGGKVPFPGMVGGFEPRTCFSLESTLPKEEGIMMVCSDWLETFPDKWQLDVSQLEPGGLPPLCSLGGRSGATVSQACRMHLSMTLSIRRVGG